MIEPKAFRRRGAPRQVWQEKIESFWFLVIIILAFIALIALSIYKALKPL